MRIFSCIALALFTFATPGFAEVKLPLTGRTVDLEFAKTLSNSDVAKAHAELAKAKVRVLRWQADKHVLEGEGLSAAEQMAIPAYLEKNLPV